MTASVQPVVSPLTNEHGRDLSRCPSCGRVFLHELVNHVHLVWCGHGACKCLTGNDGVEDDDLFTACDRLVGRIEMEMEEAGL